MGPTLQEELAEFLKMSSTWLCGRDYSNRNKPNVSGSCHHLLPSLASCRIPLTTKGFLTAPVGILHCSRTDTFCNSIAVPPWHPWLEKSFVLPLPCYPAQALVSHAPQNCKTQKSQSHLPFSASLTVPEPVNMNRWLPNRLGIVHCGSWHSLWK